jgi:hypothetical protein
MAGNRGYVNRAMEQLIPILLGSGTHKQRALASTHGWKKGYIISRTQAGIPRRKLLVSGSDQGATKTRQGRKALRVTPKQVRQRCSFGDLHDFFRQSGQLSHTPKEKHPNAKVW